MCVDSFFVENRLSEAVAMAGLVSARSFPSPCLSPHAVPLFIPFIQTSLRDRLGGFRVPLDGNWYALHFANELSENSACRVQVRLCLTR